MTEAMITYNAIPDAKREAAILILSAFKYAEEDEQKSQPFQYEPELFSDPKYYPEENREHS